MTSAHVDVVEGVKMSAYHLQPDFLQIHLWLVLEAQAQAQKLLVHRVELPLRGV